MYPEFDENATDFEKSAGMSISVLIKLKGFKHPSVGNYWCTTNKWTVSGVRGNMNDCDVEEWYYLPEIGTGYIPC